VKRLVDIHNHLLPNVDDGSRSMEETIEIVNKAEDNEIRHIVATPHYIDKSYKVDGSSIIRKVAKLNKELQKRNIDVKILAGHEVYITEKLIRRIKTEEILSINNTRYILLEMPMGFIPNNLDKILYDLKLLGYKPIIAHPERNENVIANPNIIHKWVTRGIMFQLNAGSLFGIYGLNIQKTARQLAKHHLIQLIASDCHGKTRVSQEWFFKAKSELQDICGSYGKQLYQNAEHVINDKDIIYKKPTKIKSNSFFNIFKKKD